MKKIVAELLYAMKKVLLLYTGADLNNSKEKECLDFVEAMRQKTNLKRTLLLAVFISCVSVSAVVIPLFNGEFNVTSSIGLIVSFVFLVFYIVSVQRYYMMPDDEFRTDSANRKKAASLYVAFWIAYYILLAHSANTFSNQTQNLFLWVVMVFLGISIPIYNKKEGMFVYPVEIACIFLYAYLSELGLNLILTFMPVFLVLQIFSQLTNVERLKMYYDMALRKLESYEMKRRLGKVFEEVFDLAFEFNLREANCDVLRSNPSYDIVENGQLTILSFFDQISQITYSDDYSVCQKNFNLDYLSNEFLLGRSQIYFEVRLKNKSGEYNWVSILITKENEFTEGDYLLCLIQDIEERKKNEDKLRLEAEKDPLTQLCNKMTTKSLIEECFEKNSSSQHALMVIDIDNFKTINDTKGHVIGDQILLAFAAELNKNFRESDILGRTGGDEFIVLIKNVQSIAMVCDKVQRLSSSFKKYGIDHGFPGRLSTSIGIAMFNKDGKTYEELFKKADAALYEAKRNGKDQYKFSITRT